MVMTHAICGECNKEYDYDLKPGYPRKYCPECSAMKKAQYEGKATQSYADGTTKPSTGSNAGDKATKATVLPSTAVQIVRMNSMTNAVNLFNKGLAEEKTIMEIAEEMENWVLR